MQLESGVNSKEPNNPPKFLLSQSSSTVEPNQEVCAAELAWASLRLKVN